MKIYRDYIFGLTDAAEDTKIEGWVEKYFNACYLCGYKWEWQVGTPEPSINVRPDLMAKGEQRLREEEESARGNAVAQDILRRQGVIK